MVLIMSEVSFKLMEDVYLKSIMDIYNYYVLNTTATFHTNVISIEEMRELVYFNNPKYKTLVILQNSEVCGYISLKQHKTRQAYDGTAEVTIYLKPDAIGKGLGSSALGHIEKHAEAVGIHALIASICGENENSIRLFERNGYSKCAHYREVGVKFGQILDVVAFEKILKNHLQRTDN